MEAQAIYTPHVAMGTLNVALPAGIYDALNNYYNHSA